MSIEQRSGLTIVEIAFIMGLDRRHATTLLNRAMQSFRVALADRGITADDVRPDGLKH